MATRQMVGGHEVEMVPVVDVPTALGAVRAGDADYAVVAIENTVEGGVTATLDTLAEGSPLVILGEVVLPVEFELVAPVGVSIADIRRVSAHPHAWNQVRRWANHNLPGVIFVPASSNAAAALAIASGKDVDGIPAEAALAPPGLAAWLGLSVLADHIADVAHAATRFVRVGRPEAVPAPTGHDKTTLSVHLPTDRAGALLEMLEQFAVRGVNLSRIESRPRSDRPGEYSFSIDAMGHIAERRVAEALIGLKRTCPLVVFLGSYPAADPTPTPVAASNADAAFVDAEEWVARLAAGDGA
jgi:prephenate dehydratase